MATECIHPLHYLVHYCKIVLFKLSKWHENGCTGLHIVVQCLDICVVHGHSLLICMLPDVGMVKYISIVT